MSAMHPSACHHSSPEKQPNSASMHGTQIPFNSRVTVCQQVQGSRLSVDHCTLTLLIVISYNQAKLPDSCMRKQQQQSSNVSSATVKQLIS